MLKIEFLNIFTILHITLLLFLIFYEFLVFPYCVGLMDNRKWLEIFRCKSLSRYKGENTEVPIFSILIFYKIYRAPEKVHLVTPYFFDWQS